MSQSSDTSRETEAKRPSPSLWEQILVEMERVRQEELERPTFQRDPGFLKRYQPVARLILRYFRADVQGWEHVPDAGPMLLVGNHCGGIQVPETHVLIYSWIERFGPERALYGLMHDMGISLPGVGTVSRWLGTIPANHDNAEKAFDQGAAVLVYPGGDHEAFRTWRERNLIDFGDRSGFVRLALRRQVPVIPVVAYGAHDAIVVLSRGEALARKLRLDRIRMKTFPFILGFPWGIVPGYVPSVPLPVKVRLRFLPPLDWSSYGPDAEHDPKVVRRCYDEIVAIMQKTLDRLAIDHPIPFFD